MFLMMPRRTASRATSPGVQWLIGRCAVSGSSQAMAMISRICSGRISGGRPLRVRRPGSRRSDSAPPSPTLRLRRHAAGLGLVTTVDAICAPSAASPPFARRCLRWNDRRRPITRSGLAAPVVGASSSHAPACAADLLVVPLLARVGQDDQAYETLPIRLGEKNGYGVFPNLPIETNLR